MKNYNCIRPHQWECPKKVSKTRFISVLAIYKSNTELAGIIIGQRLNGSVKSPQFFGSYAAAV